LDAVEWECCREDEGEVVVGPKVEWCERKVREVLAGSKFAKEDLLPLSEAAAYMGVTAVGEKEGNDKAMVLTLTKTL
jgi:hypothetical protein